MSMRINQYNALALPTAGLVTIGNNCVLHNIVYVLDEGGVHDSITVCRRKIDQATQYRLPHQTWCLAGTVSRLLSTVYS
jgi:hypothetical protein